MENTFLPLIFRMQHIYRWSLMYNTQKEDLKQHTAECAFISHYLAVIGNRVYNKNYNADKIAVCALYHDAAEVFTGDLPTPVKYFNNDIKSNYKQIEKIATEKLKEHLPKEIRDDYAAYLDATDLSAEEKTLIKIADKLCAYIKCINELNAGNKEFQSAYAMIRRDLDDMENQELNYFLDNCVAAFSLSLDDLKGTL